MRTNGNSLLDKGLGLVRVGELGVRDHPETGLSALESTELDFHSDTSLCGTLDVRYCDRNVLLIRLCMSA